MKVNILTLNWNGLEKITKLRDTLLPSLDGLSWQWFIRDNGSKDGSPEEISTWKGNIHCEKINHNNDNFSQGVNYLFKLSETKDDDLVLLLNNDIIFNDAQSLKKMINLFTKNKNVGVVGAKLLSLDKKTINHAGVVFSNINKLPKHFRAMELDDNYSKMNREFQAITGAVFLTRGDIYRQAGMLPEHMRWAFDDIFLSLSIKYNLNKRIIMAGDVNISHDESSSLKKNPVNKLYMNHNIQSFFKAWNSKYIIDENLYLKDKNFNIIK